MYRAIALLRFVLLLLGLIPLQISAQSADRKEWLAHLDKLARPVMQYLAEDQLKERMPVELAPGIDNPRHRTQVSYLEAFGRTLSGIAPWLQLEGGSEAEVQLREQYRQWALEAVRNAVNPKARDYLLWKGGQPLVDASFFALGLIRAPWIWEHLEDTDRERVAEVLMQTREVVPVYSNWILFSAMIEAFFCRYDLPYDPVRIEYALRIYWATTIRGRFPETQIEADNGYNHRMYYVTTKDFKTFSETELFYEPGFNVIDATVVRDSGRWVIFLKDETREPAQKNIKIACADQLKGPYSAAGEPITGDYWAEGPTATKIDGEWTVYFDKYIDHRYGAVASKDLISWHEVSHHLRMPEGIRHGTVFRISKQELQRLIN